MTSHLALQKGTSSDCHVQSSRIKTSYFPRSSNSQGSKAATGGSRPLPKLSQAQGRAPGPAVVAQSPPAAGGLCCRISVTDVSLVLGWEGPESSISEEQGAGVGAELSFADAAEKVSQY